MVAKFLSRKGGERLDKDLLKKRIAVAAKRIPADIVIKNGKIIDVFTKEIIEADVAIVDGIFAGIGSFEGEKVIDAQGKYIIPGFIDGHVHIESAMVTPAEFANVVLPHGVTTVIADPHEIANVSGVEGIQFMLDASEDVLLNVYIALPSCVPATPFENAGATLSAKDLLPLYRHERVISLGEVMDFPAVFHADEDMLEKIIDAGKANKVVDGHAAGVDADGINVYMAAGIRSDHECTTPEQVRDRLSRGMYVMLREGSASRDLRTLLQAVNENNARRCLFVTDDKHLDDLMKEGSIDYNVRVAIEHGIAPLTAIQMATLNAAEYFGLKHKGAIAPGHDADFLLIDNLEDVKIDEVFVKGMSVAKNGQCTPKQKHTVTPSEKIIESIQMEVITEDDLCLEIPEDKSANIISVIPNSIVTDHLIQSVDTKDGLFQASIEKDLLKLAVIERHRKTGNIGLGIIHGLGLKSGAIASTVAHDSHNIIATGTNDSDLIVAINSIERIKGGIVVVHKGDVIASLPLPIAGLISDASHLEVNEKLEQLNDALGVIGFTGDFNPFILLSFMALPVIPKLKLTDIGLFDMDVFKHIPIVAESVPN